MEFLETFSIFSGRDCCLLYDALIYFLYHRHFILYHFIYCDYCDHHSAADLEQFRIRLVFHGLYHINA